MSPRESAARELTERLKRGLKSGLHSVVLYGSVARGESARDSDIDILIVTSHKSLEKTASEISFQLNFEKGYRVFLSLLHLSTDEFHRLVKLGSPFLSNVLEEGKVLYDDGTYEGIRRSLFAPSR